MFEPIERQSSSYSLPIINSAHFLKAVESETLDQELAALGASNIEANGHFGSSYFYTLDSDDDTPDRHSQIRETVRKHIVA